MDNHITNFYTQYIHKSRYARWIESEKRRETWEETVERYVNFFSSKFSTAELKYPTDKIYNAIVGFDTMPSMRALMTAGPALNKDNIAGYNCAAIEISHPRAFDEMLYILSCGTGCGFSVEQKYISQLPIVNEQLYKVDTKIVVDDSRIGWASGLIQLISLLYNGQIPSWDLSKIRPKGSRLKTFGGRASGPAPLDLLFNNVVEIFKNAAGRKLTSLECHDICCHIADSIVTGGVRRCLESMTYVNTYNGIKRISDIKVGDLVLTENNYQKVIATENVGEKNTIKLKTQIGDFIVTPEHRLSIISSINPDDNTYELEYKEAQYLTTDDRLYFSEIPIPGMETKIPEFEFEKSPFDHNSIDIDINACDIIEWSWCLGFLHGNGCIKKSEKSVDFSISIDMPETKEKIISFLKKLNLNPGIIEFNGYTVVRVKSVRLWEYLSQFKQPKTEIIIPDFILSGTIETRLSYIAGVFDSDGCAKNGKSKDKRLILNTSVYPEFSHSLRCLIHSLGFATKTTIDIPKNEKWNKKYNISIIGSDYKNKFANLLKPYSEKINNDYKFLTITYNGVCSFTLPKSIIISDKFKFYTSKNNTISWKLFKKKTGFQANFIPIKVLGIESNKPEICYDIQVENDECFIAEGILSHNSALISLSDLTDYRMQTAKTGQWYITDQQRNLANNSATYTEKPEIELFVKEWLNLIESKNGERGIYNHQASRMQVLKTGRRKADHSFITNPCGEILLRSSGGICNLSEVIVRPDDTLDTLIEKQKIATIIGTYQSLLTNFRYIRKAWKKNAEEERLLGVSLTGIRDHAVLSNVSEKSREWFRTLKEVTIETNKELAEKLNINQSAATTCIKPSGCLTPESEIKTSSGYNISLDEIFLMAGYDLYEFQNEKNLWLDIKPEFSVPRVIDENNNSQEITKLFVNGIEEVYEIEFEDGKIYRMTGNHKLKTKDGWKRVDELGVIKYPDLISMKIKRIEKLDEKHFTVDIEVSETHSYQLSNGVVSHNTVSELVQTSSGIHPRYAPYYLRSVRNDIKDPLCQFMINKNVPHEPDNTKPNETIVFKFPRKSPESSVFRNDVTALEQLEHYLMIREEYCEHNPSISVYVKSNEWLAVGDWVYNHWNNIGGISFFPYSDFVYDQAPFQEIDEEEYLRLVDEFPIVDFDDFHKFENTDETIVVNELACSANTCAFS